MDNKREHRITVKISGVESFKLPVPEDEESFYRNVIEKINGNMSKLLYGIDPDSPTVALAKLSLYYASILYRKTQLINSQTQLLEDFEKRLDSLLEGTD